MVAVALLFCGAAGTAAQAQPAEAPAADRYDAAPARAGLADPAPAVPGGAEASPDRAGSRVVDPAEVEAFVDGFMTSYLEESGAVGGVVAVVANQRVVLAKGYGDDDRARHRAVDADRTLFRIGSVSKLFVWTAVMQLVEQGKLELDADVNRYLEGVSVPESFPEPVTLAHLMTHTAGFEDRVLGLFARDVSALYPLRELLGTELPARVRPAGAFASYSNHGAALAMLIVEQVSGVPWNVYLETRILAPLGMTRTTFRQPVPEALEDDLSVGYREQKGESQPAPFEYVPLAPVGAASATASDMTRFMLAHLDRGRLGETRILAEATALRMQRQLYRPEPGVPGMAHGFIEGDRNGHRVVGHGGDTLWFHTVLELYPDDGVGVFASFNTAGAQPAKLAAAFADRYFPAPAWSPLLAPPDWAGTARRFAGSYRSLRYSHHDLTKLGALLSQLEVSDAGSGALRLSSSPDQRWIQVDPLLFREQGGSSKIAFRAGRGGRITHLFLGDVPVFAFERVPWYEDGQLHLTLIIGAFLLFLGTVVLGPAGAFLRWRYRATPAGREKRLPGVARAVLWLGSLVFVLFLAGLARYGSDPLEVVFGLTPELRRVLLLPIAGAGLALASLASTIWIWRSRRGGAVARLAYTAVVVAFLIVLWQLTVWRFL